MTRTYQIRLLLINGGEANLTKTVADRDAIMSDVMRWATTDGVWDTKRLIFYPPHAIVSVEVE